MSYFYQFDDVQVPQLFQFINRAEGLRLARFRRAGVYLYDTYAYTRLDKSRAETHYSQLFLEPPYRQSIWLVRSMGQLFTQSSAMISTVRHLSIAVLTERQGRHGNMNNAEWLDLLRQFFAVETLHFGGLSVIFVVPALDDLTEEMTAEVLPALRLLNLEGWSLRFFKQLKFIA